MNYSIEDIYKFSGQFDKMASVSFYNNSDAFNKYGSYVTGTFYYTPDERVELQGIINQGEYERNDGLVKIQISHSKELTNEQKNELKYNGINASDISEILSLMLLLRMNIVKLT